MPACTKKDKALGQPEIENLRFKTESRYPSKLSMSLHDLMRDWRHSGYAAVRVTSRPEPAGHPSHLRKLPVPTGLSPGTMATWLNEWGVYLHEFGASDTGASVTIAERKTLGHLYRVESAGSIRIKETAVIDPIGRTLRRFVAEGLLSRL